MEKDNKNTPSGGKKSGGWGVEAHLVKCPSCGKDILDHMTQCPFCKSEVEPQGAKPMDSGAARRVRIIVLIAAVIIALIIVVPILMDKFACA